jgi:uncharacterized protein YpmB
MPKGWDMATIVVIIVCAVVGITASLITKQDDSPIEEEAEEVIQQETGLEIDLSPRSPEKH